VLACDAALDRLKGGVGVTEAFTSKMVAEEITTVCRMKGGMYGARKRLIHAGR